MRKFGVFSGFLGSGKTTTMMALTKYITEKYVPAAMITNDLGGEGLADHRFAKFRGCHAVEMAGECICYQTENLVHQLDALFEEGCELVLSDIPGFGVGALDHVYHGMTARFPDACTLAPFTVLVEPKTIGLLREEKGGDMEYIFRSQLQEADLIVLNKCDCIGLEEKNEAIHYLNENYPEAKVVTISALTGEGLEDLAQALIFGTASMHLPDIGYGGPAFGKAMRKIHEYNMQYYAVVCCDTFDGNAYLMELAKGIQQEIRKADAEIPHLKLLAWEPEGEYAKVDLLGVDRPIEVNQSFLRPCTELAVVLNTSAICPGMKLGEIFTEQVNQISGQFNLTLMVHKQDFPMD